MSDTNATPPPPPEGGQSNQGQPQYQQPQGQPAPAAPLSDSDSRLWATLAHVGIAVSSVVGITIFAPLVIWLIFRERSAYVDAQGKEAVNLSIVLFLGYVISIPLMFVIIGFLTLFILWVLAIVFGIMGAIAANKGEDFRYPFNIRFIK